MNHERELLDRYWDGELSAGDEHRLAEWLAADREHVREFVRESQLHHQLREAMQVRRFQANAAKALEEPAPGLRSSPLHQFEGRLAHLSKIVKVRFGRGGNRSVDAPSEMIGSTRTRNGRGRSVTLQGKRRWTGSAAALAIAASVTLLIGVTVWLFPPVTNEPTLALTAGAQVTIRRGTEEFAASDEARLVPGDTLVVVGTNSVALRYGDEPTHISLFDGTELKLTSFSSGKRFELLLGKVEASVARQRPLRPLIVRTAEAEARVLGTRFSLAPTADGTRLEVVEGRVKLTRKSDDAAVTVNAGEYAVAVANSELMAHPLTGGVFREYWTNLTGENVADLITHANYPDVPDGENNLTNLASLEMLPNWTDNYGVRLRGYLHIPETGEYTFWIAARDDASLWLSWDEDPEHKIHMAHSDAVSPRDWQDSDKQQSAAVPFTAGKRYYFEVLHKAGEGDDHLAVAWRRPGGAREPIPGTYLSPFKTRSASKEKKR